MARNHTTLDSMTGVYARWATGSNILPKVSADRYIDNAVRYALDQQIVAKAEPCELRTVRQLLQERVTVFDDPGTRMIKWVSF